MTRDIEIIALEWNSKDKPSDIPGGCYCESRDIFQARLDGMTECLLAEYKSGESAIYIISAVAGEIGNNSFDHNLGNWPDVPGIFFGYELKNGGLAVVLSDRGQGLLKTLQKVKPELSDEKEALQVAFFEKITGRAPENRGNGLKFVRESVKAQNFHLTFTSGDARAKLNRDFEIDSPDQKIHGCMVIIEAKL